MPQQKNTFFLHLAMYYGVYLGLFWAFKYMVFIASHSVPALMYLYYMLNGGTFLFIYIYYFNFRDTDPNKQQSVWHCIGFIMALCFFASFFESMMIYIHLQFIDPAYFYTSIEPVLKALEAIPYPPKIKSVLIGIVNSKLFFVGGNIFVSTVLGSILGVALALIIGNKKNN